MQVVSAVVSAETERTQLRHGRILIFESDAGVARSLAALLTRRGHLATAVSTMREAARALERYVYDVALVAIADEDDVSIARIAALWPQLTLIVLTRVATFDSALQALRDGAYDYLVKPVDMDELCARIDRALERTELQRELSDRVRELEEAHRQAQSFNARLQQQVERSTDNLRAKVEELDASNAQLRKSQEEHDRFVAMVAHEMRGPLNPIINYAQLAKRPGLPHETVEQYADIVVEHAFRLNRLVEDLLTATRLSTGHFALRRQPADVAAAVEGLVQEFRAAVHDRHFSLARPSEPLIAEVDVDRVVQAVRNLIDNAVKYSTGGGAVEIAVESDAERVYVHVRDYGAGIPEEQMREIFEPFIRLGKDA